MAHAHLVSTGLGPLYDGIGHFLVSLEELLPLVALTMLAAMHGAAGGRRALFLLPPAWLAGALAGLLFAMLPVIPAGVLALVVMLIGGLIAADWRLSPGRLQWLLLCFGALAGVGSGRAFADQPQAMQMLLGGALSLWVLCALLAGAVVGLSRGVAWLRIVVRVGGSWLVAFGLLLLGWQLRA
jgi:urease accessory protein